MTPGGPGPHPVLAQVVREDWGRLLGLLIRRHGRPDLAEDALAEALASAAEQWPRDGIPDNPQGWLTQVASRRLLDAIRREATAAGKAHLLAVPEEAPPRHTHGPGGTEDDRLPLLFMATHPALAPEVRPALALRFVLGVPTADIAALFLVPTTTMAARLTRAKQRLRAIGAGFRVPEEPDLGARVDDVARAIYLAFTAGYAPREGEAVVHVEATGEAVRLAHLTRALLPNTVVLQALCALLTLQHARRDARTDEQGGLVRLADQDRSLWRRDEIDAGLVLLQGLSPTKGYAEELRLQALVGAFHDSAATSAETDWAAIARTYARLERLTGSPIVRLNRAVAVAEVSGPMAGLRLLQAAADQLPGHHRIHVVRAGLLRREGDTEGARAAYDQALKTCPDGPERRHLLSRLGELPPA
ncbi:MAG: RNA polymerase subunit sigma-24 [Actinobacteria bacterium]|nr:RNA polymerase subunit sigma-24 [Actinomycetota bacterium]